MMALGPDIPLTQRALAEQYLRDAAPIYGFVPEETTNFAASRMTTFRRLPLPQRSE
jgi:hypothetical protein